MNEMAFVCQKIMHVQGLIWLQRKEEYIRSRHRSFSPHGISLNVHGIHVLIKDEVLATLM